jgi:hypothetical protein
MLRPRPDRKAIPPESPFLFAMRKVYGIVHATSLFHYLKPTEPFVRLAKSTAFM